MTEDKLNAYLEFCRKNGFDISRSDSNQRMAVLDDRYSVLPAGAGSGKTTVLTYRFLRLLMDDEIERIHSDEILTITFTKAATANMRAKIYLILKKAEKEGLIGTEELERFSSAEISTTDSFCSKIVRSDCTRYGISTSFSIEDEADFSSFIERVLREIIEEKIEKDEEVRKLSSLVSFDNLLSAFRFAADNSINIALPFTENPTELYQQILDETLSQVREGIDKKKKNLVDKLNVFISSFKGYDSIKGDTEHAEHIMSFLIDRKEIPLDSKFTQKRSLKESPGQFEEYKREKEEIKKAYSDYLACVEYREEGGYYLLKGYTSLLTAFQERILRHKREDGVLTFHDVMLLAIDILHSNVSIRRYYNSRFKRIMVDEFQDNNEENKRLIYLLAAKPEFTSEERYPSAEEIIIDKVFMVGDEKQSIYRFRGADVSVFKNISRDFGRDRVLPLSENFRSENDLIRTINKIFDNSIMPQYSEEEYEAEYTPLVSRRERVKSNVSFRYMNAKNISDDIDKDLLASNSLSEAHEVARIIREEILGSEKNKYMVWDNNAKALRSPRYSDISILLRTGSSQSAFEKALRLYNIPFTVSDNKSLTMDAVLNDFYNVLQYSVYGNDDPLSFASLLRSPFVNMNDRDLEKVVRNIRNGIEAESGLSEDGKERLAIMEELIEVVREREKRDSLTSLMHYLWFDCGYRYFIETEAKNESYSEHFDYLFSIASDYDSKGKSIIELLDRIRPSLGDTSDFKDLIVQREAREGVTIQTIHKSKGLEYPIVFISDMGVKSKNDSFPVTVLPSSLPFFKCFITNDGELKNPLEEIRSEEMNRIENAETKRILYVAATRSEHHLIFTSVFGVRAVDGDGKISEVKVDKKNNLLQYLVKGLDFDFESGSDIIETREFSPVYRYVFKEKREAAKRRKEEIERWYSSPEEIKTDTEVKKVGVTTLIGEDVTAPDEFIPLPEIKADRILGRVKGEEKLNDEEIKEEREKRITTFGTLVHLLLENAVLSLDTDTSSFFRDDSSRGDIIESAFSLRDNFLLSEFRKKLDGYTLYPEKEFYIRDGNTIVEGIIDLLCVSKEKVIIVDYKTDSLMAPERHRAQLGYYTKALSTIYKGKEIEAYIFYLRSGEEVKLI